MRRGTTLVPAPRTQRKKPSKMDNGPMAGGIPERVEAQGMLQLARWETVPPLWKASQPMGFLSGRRCGNGLALVEADCNYVIIVGLVHTIPQLACGGQESLGGIILSALAEYQV
ncbi:hypothetical protein SAMN05444162_1563 [Paenibacillaceae bacterium GAS479]|nr:hypothetical protein SAMN05444162_1563 [Paenibacillaceae bacterium GAS479]